MFPNLTAATTTATVIPGVIQQEKKEGRDGNGSELMSTGERIFCSSPSLLLPFYAKEPVAAAAAAVLPIFFSMGGNEGRLCSIVSLSLSVRSRKPIPFGDPLNGLSSYLSLTAHRCCLLLP